MLKSSSESRDSVVVLHFKGQLDAQSTRDMLNVKRRLEATGIRKVVCDFKEISLLDSVGLGSMLALCESARAKNGRVAITNLMSQPRVVFNALKMDRHIPVYDSVDRAVDSLHRLP